MISAEALDKLFAGFANIRVCVIGDVMLDTYWWGKTDRISPEAPVPVVAVSHNEQRIGGAGNVALNAAALGAKVDIITVAGKDNEGAALFALLNHQGISTDAAHQSADRLTTNKIRIISRNQQMLRLDKEIVSELSEADQATLLVNVEKYIGSKKPDIIILEDYNKGVLSKALITQIIALCKKSNVLTAVDPKRKNFFEYQGVDIFKPNLAEVKDGLNLLSERITPEWLRETDEKLRQRLGHNISFITLSERGVFCSAAGKSEIIPAHIRAIADVSGAGDTVIATAAVVYAASKDAHLMAELANIAGGLVCEEVGTVAIKKDALLAEAKKLLPA